MSFAKWLIAEENRIISFVSWDSYGYITVNINGKKYIYNVSPHLHPSLQKEARFKPFSALNMIKKIDPNPKVM